MMGRTEPQWLTQYKRACWQVWSPEELVGIGKKRRAMGYDISLDCDTMIISGHGTEPGFERWSWHSDQEETIDFIDNWMEYGVETQFLDWFAGHLWCFLDMPREMPPLPEEFFASPKRSEA